MSQFVDYRGHRIHCQVEGKGEAVVFLHGWPTNSLLWQAQVEALRTGFKVITLDWLGFGRSDSPADFHYTFPRQKEVLDTVLKTLLPDRERVTLVAHDLGGPSAILWASEHPARVERLILLNTVLYPFKTRLDALSEVLLRTPLLREIFVSRSGLRAVLKTNTRSRGRLRDERIAAILGLSRDIPSKVRRKTILEPLETGRRLELRTLAGTFRELPVKKYLVIARRDPLCYAHIRKLSEENPEVPVYPLADCGHFIPIDRAEELSGVLAEVMGAG